MTDALTGESDAQLARATAAMTALTAVSRITGFIRIAVVAAVLGTTFLGNTYQSANTIPNILFELLAAGALQAVLIPTLVDLIDSGRRADADYVAGTVFGLAATVLASLSALGMLLSPWILRVMVSGVADADVRDAQVRLGTFFLWFFLPQTVFYAASTVATALLNATGRFVVPVAAPIVNNVVVIGAYVAFHVMRDGASPSLEITLAQKLVLAGGTTAAVIAFCAVPVIAARRAGFRLRPRFDRHHPVVRALVRQGAWAAVYLAFTQVLLAVVLILANRIEGGVVAYQVAFTLFLLPHALFAVPALTALFPRLSRQALASDWQGFAGSIERGVDAIAFAALAAGGALFALAEPLARLVLFGAGANSVGAVAATIRGFAPGIIGYGGFLFLTRAFYALRDARTPAVANGLVVVAGSIAMAVGFAIAERPSVAILSATHSVVYVTGSAGLLLALTARGRASASSVTRDVAGHAAAAVASAAAMALVANAIGHDNRPEAALAVLCGGGVGAAVFLLARAAVRRRGGPLLPVLLTPWRG